MKISKVKELVLKNELAIENDSTVSDLRKVLKYCFPNDESDTSGSYKYYLVDDYNSNVWDCFDRISFKSIKVSQIELIPSFKEQVIELRKQYPNDFDFGGAVNKLLNE